MKTPRLSRSDFARIEAAVAAAELGHRGELRVHIESRYPGDGPLHRAAEIYAALGMSQTQDDTAALLYIALTDRKVAVWHGAGLAGATAPGFWQTVTDTAAAACRSGELVAGICTAIAMMGNLMREVAPGDDVAGDELSNAVSTPRNFKS